MFILYIINYIMTVFKVHLRSPQLNSLLGLVIVVLASLIVGTRELNAGFDTKGYVEAYSLLDTNIVSSYIVIKQYFGISIEPLFWGFAWVLSKLGATPEQFLLIVAFISIFLTGYTYRKIDPEYYYLSFVGVLFSGSFISLYGNAMRQGMAIPFFLLALYFFMQGRNRKAILFAIITFFIHQYTGALVFLFYLSRLVPWKLFPVIWLGSLLMAIAISSGVLNWIPGIAHYAKASGLAYLVHPTYIEFPIYYYLLHRFNMLEDEKLEKMVHFMAAVFLLQTIFITNIYSYNRIGLMRFVLEPIIYARLFTKLKPVKASHQLLLLLFLVYGTMIYFSESVQKTLNPVTDI